MNIVNTIRQLVALATASAEVVDALNAIRSGYTDEQFEQLEEAHPLIAALISSAVELEEAMEREG